MNLYRKSREDIAELTRRRSHQEMVDLLYRHCSLEPMFSPESIALAHDCAPKTIKKLMIAGRIAAHTIGNRLRATLSAVRAWDEQTAITLGKRDPES